MNNKTSVLRDNEREHFEGEKEEQTSITSGERESRPKGAVPFSLDSDSSQPNETSRSIEIKT